MNTTFIALENGSVIRKRYVNMIHLVYDMDSDLYKLEVHHRKGVITKYYCDEEDAKRELERLVCQLLEGE